MRHFNRSSTYSTRLSQSSRQQSLPEIRQFMRSGEAGSSATVGKRTLQLPLDKSSSRFLRQSVQNFLLQEDEEKYEEDLERLKLSSEAVETLCDRVASGHVTSKDVMEQIEQRITSFSQQASRLWTMLKKPMQTTCADNSVGEPAPYLNNEIILELCTIVEGHNDVLGNYCKSLETQGLLGPYKWSDAGVISAVSPCMRAEELMSMMQSREYQVKFCHANITHHRKNSICQDAVSATDKDTTTGYAANQSVLSMNDADEENCLKSLWKSTLMSKLILGIGAAVVVLLIITVALVVALR